MPYYSGYSAYCRVVFGVKIEALKKLKTKTIEQQQFLDKLANEKECLRDWKNYMKNNPDNICDERITKYQEDREIARESYKKYYRNHKDACLIYSQKREAKKKNLSATLTLEQWENTKNFFDNRCCYCGVETNLVQEHFIPVSKNGVYSEENIVPSCRSCNSSKRDKFFKDWYNTYMYYDKGREEKIQKFIKEKYNVLQESKNLKCHQTIDIIVS